MSDIFHDFPVKTTVDRVFQAISTPEGLDCWWTKNSSGQPTKGGAKMMLSLLPTIAAKIHLQHSNARMFHPEGVSGSGVASG
jgi:hypothetical protein